MSDQQQAPETRTREVRHDNGIHVYEGHIAIIEHGRIVHKVSHLATFDMFGNVNGLTPVNANDDGFNCGMVRIGGLIHYLINGVIVWRSDMTPSVADEKADERKEAPTDEQVTASGDDFFDQHDTINFE